jgi:hypothetical protein
MNFGARTWVRGIMTEPKKPINFFKMLPSFQSPGIKVGLQHGDGKNPRQLTFVCAGAAPAIIR